MKFFLWKVAFYVTIVKSFISKLNANVHLSVLICIEILHISLLKMPFLSDKYYQILTSIHEHMILIEHIHCLEGIFRILLDFSFNVCLVA